MNLTFENHKNGNGGFISLKNEIEEIGRLTYTIQPEKNTLIISYVIVNEVIVLIRNKYLNVFLLWKLTCMFNLFM